MLDITTIPRLDKIKDYSSDHERFQSYYKLNQKPQVWSFVLHLLFMYLFFIRVEYESEEYKFF